MKSTAKTVPEYLAALPADRRTSLVRLRKICRDALPGFTETMRFGMPCFQKDGETVVSFARQKQHISLYVGRPAVVDTFRSRLGQLNVGKGCIRFSKVEQMDFELLQEILES